MKSQLQSQNRRHVRYIDWNYYHACYQTTNAGGSVYCETVEFETSQSCDSPDIESIAPCIWPARIVCRTRDCCKKTDHVRTLINSSTFDQSIMTGEVHCDDHSNSGYDLSFCRLLEGVGDRSRWVTMLVLSIISPHIANKPNSPFVHTKTTSGEIRISIWSSNKKIKKGEETLVAVSCMYLPNFKVQIELIDIKFRVLINVESFNLGLRRLMASELRYRLMFDPRSVCEYILFYVRILTIL